MRFGTRGRHVQAVPRVSGNRRLTSSRFVQLGLSFQVARCEAKVLAAELTSYSVPDRRLLHGRRVGRWSRCVRCRMLS